jgi:Trk-type K+ transport system membrane component
VRRPRPERQANHSGIIPALTAAGKLVLCAEMFVGRLGPLTVVCALRAAEAGGEVSAEEAIGSVS